MLNSVSANAPCPHAVSISQVVGFHREEKKTRLTSGISWKRRKRTREVSRGEETSSIKQMIAETEGGAWQGKRTIQTT